MLKIMKKSLAQVNPVVYSDAFEKEFRRIYSDLYPDEKTLKEAIGFYGRDHPFMQFAEVDEDPRGRIEYFNWWMNKSYGECPEDHSSYLFSDVKKLIGNSAIDLAHLSPAVVSPFFNQDGLKVNVGKCICALKKNKVNIGSFSKVLWQRGQNYSDAVEDGLTKGGDEPFATSLNAPTYNRPILVINNSFDEGVMLGEYINFLSERGIGIIFWKHRGIPGFCFVGKQHNDYKYRLDVLDFF